MRRGRYKILMLAGLLGMYLMINGCAPAIQIGVGLAGDLAASLLENKTSSEASKSTTPHASEEAAFAAGIDTEKTVRARLDKGGAPITELIYNDHIPVTKILFYQRDDLRHPILFTYDNRTKEFVFQEMLGISKEKYEDLRVARNPDFKEFFTNWYYEVLAIKANKYEKAQKYDLQYETVKKMEDIYPISYVAYNQMAWFYASCQKNEYRNGKKAVEYAEKSVAIKKEANSLDTLAAAYAENGNFEKAVQVEQEAIDLAPGDKKDTLIECLGAYKDKKTYAMYKYGETAMAKPLNPTSAASATPNNK